MHIIKKFTAEIGAWGYPTRNVLSCLRKQEFSNKLATLTSKIFSGSHIRYMFCLYLASAEH